MTVRKRILSAALCCILLLGIALPAYAKEKDEPAELTISTAEEFLVFAENCRLDSFSQGLSVALEADIDLGGTDFSAIPIFCGSFYGNGHTISGLCITASGSVQGLFRYLSVDALVQELNVEGKIQPGGSRNQVGGIAGENAGQILSCSFSGSVSGGDSVGGLVGANTATGLIKDCQVSGNIHGNHFVGGIAGENSGVIDSCVNRGQINTTPQQNDVNISDITMDTLINTESASSVTDIGGIAGASLGTLRDCENHGSVGYPHMGYNIGGIAGSLTGYMENCRNTGEISGRKDVGGIAGQLEPAVTLRYETDTLQILRAQLGILQDLTDKARMNAQANTDNIKSLLDSLEYYTWRAEKALDVLTIDPDNPQLEDPETYLEALQTLSSSLTGMNNTIRRLMQAVQDTGEDLSADLQAVSDQVDVITGTLENGEANLGGSVSDVSDADTETDLTSKIVGAQNLGSVLGDWNVGGICGAMALENDLDPEADVTIYGETSLNAAGNVRSVILDSLNCGDITIKRQRAGGIVGWQSLGLVRGCTSTGDLTGESASYLGGIAGASQGYLRKNYAKCEITASAYAGGIAGSGVIVTDCISMVQLRSATEKLGAILGELTESEYHSELAPVQGNLYPMFDKDPGAVDGISYAGMAEGMAPDAFFAQEDLPEIFQTVCVCFVFADGTEEKIDLLPGSALDAEQIPLLPEKAGFTARWEGLADADLSSIVCDLRFDAIYTAYRVTIQSEQTRENGLPLILLEGSFSETATVLAESSLKKPDLTEKQTLLESWAIRGPESTETVRILLPEDLDTEYLQLYISYAGSWEEIPCRVDGSYAVFSVSRESFDLALVQYTPSQAPLYVFIGVLASLTVAICVGTAIRKKRKARAKASQEANATEATNP